MADALSRKSGGRLSRLILENERWPLVFEEFGLEAHFEPDSECILEERAGGTLQEIFSAKKYDPQLQSLIEKLEAGEVQDGYTHSADGGLQFCSRLCVPSERDLEGAVARLALPCILEVQRSRSQKAVLVERDVDVAKFVSKCLTCQQVKAEHQRPAGMVQPLPVAEYKWE